MHVGLDDLYVRIRAMCCAEWSMTPGQFERSCDAGDVAIEDVVELYLYRASEPFLGERINPWLFREESKAKADLKARAQALIFEMRATTDVEKREKIANELREINRRS